MSAAIDTVTVIPTFNSWHQVTVLSTSNVSDPPSAPVQPNQKPDGIGIELTSDITLVAGQPIFIAATGLLAVANSLAMPGIGVVVADARAGTPVTYVSDGSVSSPDWSVVTGSQHLTPGAIYYLSTDGKLSRAQPTVGLFQQIGIAVSASMLDVEIHPPIQLA